MSYRLAEVSGTSDKGVVQPRDIPEASSTNIYPYHDRF